MKKIIVLALSIIGIAPMVLANDNECSIEGNTCSFYYTDKKGGKPIETKLTEIMYGYQGSLVSKQQVPVEHTVSGLVESVDECKDLVANHIGEDKHARYWLNNFCASTPLLKPLVSGDI